MRQFNELDVSKIGDERHVRPNFDIELSKIGDEKNRAERFQKIKSIIEKHGWKIVSTQSPAYAEIMVVAAPRSRKEVSEVLRGVGLQQVSAAFTPTQSRMMSASKDVQDIANMISEDNPNVVNETWRKTERITQDWTQKNASLTPYLPQEPPDFENPLDNIIDEFGGYTIKYKIAATGYPEEPQTLEYPGCPGHIEIDNVEVVSVQRGQQFWLDAEVDGGSEVMTIGGGRPMVVTRLPASLQFINAAKEYFWDHIGDTDVFQTAMDEAFPPR